MMICCTLVPQAVSQDKGTVFGRVLDKETRKPLEYSNIILFSTPDSLQVTGTVTTSDGLFTLEGLNPGLYFVEVMFLGYERRRIPVSLTGGEDADLGDLLIEPSALLLEGVIVESERPSLTYQIDKKVIDVRQMSTTISGNAAEVLENIPSVSVDIEGNVALRGSSNFTVLIDGRPTIMDAQDVLQQIPASSIGRIEIITNPSAKYDPEGTAGIINIILTKHNERGLSGLVTANLGLKEKYGGDVLLEYADPGFKALFAIDHNNRFFGGAEREENSTAYQGTLSHTTTQGDSRRGRIFWGLRGALEFTLSPLDFLTIGVRHGQRENIQSSILHHDQWSEPALQHILSTNTVHRSRKGSFNSLMVNYLRKFNADGHEINADLQLGWDRSDEYTGSELHAGPNVLSGKKTTEAGPEKEFEGKIEYVLPVRKGHRFEAGYQGEAEYSSEATGLLEYDTVGGAYTQLPQFTRDVSYETNEHAVYSLYTGEIGSLGFQGGLRGEYTQRNVRLNQTGEAFAINRWDYFPTLHATYKFGSIHQILGSYTRRINRPGGWELEPFETWMDANNVRRGNPSLVPEYIDSYEFGFQTLVGGVSLTAELYNSVRHNKIEDVRTVYGENVTLRTPANVGKDYSFGTEFLANFDPLSGLNVNLVGNLYRYRIEGTVLGEPFTRSSVQWTARMNSTFKLGKSTQMSLNTRVESATVTSQGTRKGFASVDLALKQDLLQKQLSLILQVRNILGSADREFSHSGNGFSLYRFSERESPVVMLTVRYRLNDFQRNEAENENRGDEGGDEF